MSRYDQQKSAVQTKAQPGGAPARSSAGLVQARQMKSDVRAAEGYDVQAKLMKPIASTMAAGATMTGGMFGRAVSWLSGGGEDQQATQAEQPEAGSAMMVGAASDSEMAYDASFTPALLDALRENPGLSTAEALQIVSERDLNVGATKQPKHHPAIAQYGDEGANKNEQSKKRAIFVANQDHGGEGDLETPIKEARSLESTLSARGYESLGVHEDLKAGEMRSPYWDAFDQTQAGDELFAYFSGHGGEEGLCGTDYGILSHGEVNKMLTWGADDGKHVKFVADACHSGAGAQLVREERANKLKDEGNSVVDQVYMQGFDIVQGYKAQLLDLVHQRKDVIADVQAQLDELDGRIASDPSVELIELRKSLFRQRRALAEPFNRKADALWASMLPTLKGMAVATWIDWPPVTIDNYLSLGSQIDYLDDLANATMKPVDDRK